MSDWKRALFGLRVGDEFEPGQTVFAICNALPLPAVPETMEPDLLNRVINAADLAHDARLMVTDDCLIFLVDESMTRVLKSTLLEHVPAPFSPVMDMIGSLVDAEDNIVRWHRSEIAEVGSYRYDYHTHGLWGAEKVLPLYYHGVRDHSGYWYLYLQARTSRLEIDATAMASALLGLAH